MASTKINTTAEKKSLNKSDFIRSQPATLSASEVVAKAKAEGIQLDPALVYKVRRRAGAKAEKRRPGPSAIAGAGRRSRATSKAAFVRSHANLSPKEIVAKAAAAGIKLGVGYVYNVRGVDKITARRARVGARTVVVKTAAAARATSAQAPFASSAENLLMAVAAEVGLGRAIELLEGQRAKVMAVMGT